MELCLARKRLARLLLLGLVLLLLLRFGVNGLLVLLGRGPRETRGTGLP